MVAVLGKERREERGALFEPVPVVVADPVVEAAAADVEELCDLRFGEICLEVQLLCLLFLMVVHSWLI